MDFRQYFKASVIRTAWCHHIKTDTEINRSEQREQQTSIYPSSKFLAFLLHLVFGGSILKPSPDIITFPSQIFPTASLKNKDTSCITTRPLSQLTNPIVMPQYHLMLKPCSDFPQLFQKVFPVESGCKKGLCPHCH